MSSVDEDDIGRRLMDEICQKEKRAYLIKDPEKRQQCLCAVKKIRDLLNE